MRIILVPGLWLGGWSWWEVVPELERAGHQPVPMTLPGMQSADADRSGITLADHVAAVVAEIDAAAAEGEEQVVLVGHSAGAGIVYAALDARVDRVARAILIGGFPTADGSPLLNGFTVEDGEVAMPPWEEFDEADLRDLVGPGRDAFRAYALPSPGGVVTGVQHLGDDRRYDVPITAIATEYTVADLQEWIAGGEAPVQEFAKFTDVTYLDVPTGHWPQLTKPVELSRAILAQSPLGGAGDEPERVTARAFHAAPGVDDWRVIYWGAHAFYGTGGFAAGAEFVSAVAAIAEELGHFPDVDLRPEGVVVRTATHRDGGLGPADVELAQRVTAAARERGLEADPSQLQAIGLAIAQAPGVHVRPFWAAALGYDPLGGEDAVDPLRRGPHLWFHEIDPPVPGRGRLHVDVSVPADQAEARVAAALAAGGRLADDSHAPEWWTLASPDNHGVDIAGWADYSDE